MFDPGLGTLFDDVFFVELNVTTVKDRIFGRANVDEGCLHAGKNILNSTQIDIAVNLFRVVGRTTHVVLDQTASFKKRDLREIFAHLNTHRVAAQRSTVALFAATTLDQFGIGFDY